MSLSWCGLPELEVVVLVDRSVRKFSSKMMSSLHLLSSFLIATHLRCYPVDILKLHHLCLKGYRLIVESHRSCAIKAASVCVPVVFLLEICSWACWFLKGDIVCMILCPPVKLSMKQIQMILSGCTHSTYMGEHCIARVVMAILRTPLCRSTGWFHCFLVVDATLLQEQWISLHQSRKVGMKDLVGGCVIKRFIRGVKSFFSLAACTWLSSLQNACIIVLFVNRLAVKITRKVKLAWKLTIPCLSSSPLPPWQRLLVSCDIVLLQRDLRNLWDRRLRENLIDFWPGGKLLFGKIQLVARGVLQLCLTLVSSCIRFKALCRHQRKLDKVGVVDAHGCSFTAPLLGDVREDSGWYLETWSPWYCVAECIDSGLEGELVVCLWVVLSLQTIIIDYIACSAVVDWTLVFPA